MANKGHVSQLTLEEQNLVGNFKNQLSRFSFDKQLQLAYLLVANIKEDIKSKKTKKESKQVPSNASNAAPSKKTFPFSLGAVPANPQASVSDNSNSSSSNNSSGKRKLPNDEDGVSPTPTKYSAGSPAAPASKSPAKKPVAVRPVSPDVPATQVLEWALSPPQSQGRRSTGVPQGSPDDLNIGRRSTGIPQGSPVDKGRSPSDYTY